jgi:hypothetical protein
MRRKDNVLAWISLLKERASYVAEDVAKEIPPPRSASE